MAYDKVVDSAFLEAGLTLVGDSIRAKGGISAKLEFPNGMKAAVEAIDTSEDLDDVLAAQDTAITAQDDIIAQIQASVANKCLKPEQTKTATPSLSQQTISPDSGKVLSGVTVEPITSSLLTSLDPDFKPENIAKDANLFGLIGTHAAGAKIASGTFTSQTGTTYTISGLSFTPVYVAVIFTGGTANNNKAFCAYKDDTYSYAFFHSGSGSLGSYGGVTVAPGQFTLNNGANWNGTYTWFAAGQ